MESVSKLDGIWPPKNPRIRTGLDNLSAMVAEGKKSEAIKKALSELRRSVGPEGKFSPTHYSVFRQVHLPMHFWLNETRTIAPAFRPYPPIKIDSDTRQVTEDFLIAAFDRQVIDLHYLRVIGALPDEKKLAKAIEAWDQEEIEKFILKKLTKEFRISKFTIGDVAQFGLITYCKAPLKDLRRSIDIRCLKVLSKLHQDEHIDARYRYMSDPQTICDTWRAREVARHFSSNPSKGEISRWYLTLFGHSLVGSPLRNALHQLEKYVDGKGGYVPRMTFEPYRHRVLRRAEARDETEKSKFPEMFRRTLSTPGSTSLPG